MPASGITACVRAAGDASRATTCEYGCHRCEGDAACRPTAFATCAGDGRWHVVEASLPPCPSLAPLVTPSKPCDEAVAGRVLPPTAEPCAHMQYLVRNDAALLSGLSPEALGEIDQAADEICADIAVYGDCGSEADEAGAAAHHRFGHSRMMLLAANPAAPRETAWATERGMRDAVAGMRRSLVAMANDGATVPCATRSELHAQARTLLSGVDAWARRAHDTQRVVHRAAASDVGVI